MIWKVWTGDDADGMQSVSVLCDVSDVRRVFQVGTGRR